MRISDWSSDVCSSDLDDLAGYVDKPNYFGVTVGRYANRIAGGRFALDGRSYQLPLNNGANSLHGGPVGFDKRLWTIESVESGPTARVTMTLTSPAGDQGYPGTLHVPDKNGKASGWERVCT